MNRSSPTVLVLADPKVEYLSPLDRFRGAAKFLISDQVECLRESAPKADAILFISSPQALRAIFPHATRLGWIHSFSAGVESILFPELVQSPVILTNSRGVYRRALAEFAMAGILFFIKDFRRLLGNQDQGIWEQFQVDQIHGKVMGIIGYGETGRACAELARAFGMKVLGLRRRPNLSDGDRLLDKVFGREGLLEMLTACDYVVLTAPGTPETRYLIGAAEIAAMRSQAVLINLGRGSLIDENALIEALDRGRIRGAALDVFEVEPLPAGHRFYDLKNVLLSPHSTDHTIGWQSLALEFFMQNLERFIDNQPLENIVDKQNGY